ncbi:hypothetical protein A3D85_03040 [Candidatus Amesbacteria bacterium RIFCSPHIGHO2_02_FULL_47_9]|uniref:Phosphoglycerate mutase n=1 Tax=Candidatus Amesbacteria bacterium RIFCSPHIGHO2_01_FULL_48_32b TaxID=1797253 RepID=A0A1F4YCD8_9BACT|nr:MAG: hypothetical protein A2876_03745 [Candidatus Amesbacteria bacterium RIFCSPHIGHO2_01_FULL_48_32b]OGD04876.1 MAG: hypothetical protein A3D85_03040 [Candidatus Amesbacteria bacterium RIFCSPHIGHO2_02_FULL_47_9]OGD06867.1 MAG: hypothetical protein A2899_03275 [Candidatus Amesbacteria bacterium RIFCSPLOWO2_01_FULL_49_25]
MRSICGQESEFHRTMLSGVATGPGQPVTANKSSTHFSWHLFGAEVITKSMSKIFLVRHAESIANTEGRYQGQSYDTQLSQLGEHQAHALANHLRRLSLDRVITSPLRRTFQTAHTSAVHHGLFTIKEPRLIESNHGLWESLTKEEVASAWPDVYHSWQTQPSDTVFPQGEPFLATCERVLSWWKEIILLEGHTLVVTHDNIIRIILTHILDYPLDKLWLFKLQPAAITTIEHELGQIIKVDINSTDHLQNLQSNLALHAL